MLDSPSDGCYSEYPNVIKIGFLSIKLTYFFRELLRNLPRPHYYLESLYFLCFMKQLFILVEIISNR